ncbi:MAG TPA: hypothetical protein VLD39_00515, partial [Gammaproteobacteria bacterium]|nr:hypothetical protein [Gammaproteobacteria bacterium]
TFKYDAVNFGLVNWTGVKLYVFTWDIDGIGDQLRPLEASPGPFIYGGRQNASDPLVLDDIAVITVPAP